MSFFCLKGQQFLKAQQFLKGHQFLKGQTFLKGQKLCFLRTKKYYKVWNVTT